MVFKKIFLFVIFLAVISCISINYKLPMPEDNLLEVKKGQTTRTISNSLISRDLIISANLFNIYARIQNLDSKLRAGEFKLQSFESIYSLINSMTIGQMHKRKFTILPGKTLKQIIDEGYKVGLLNDIEKKPTELIMEEGKFFPDTYFFLKGESLSKVLLKSQRKWNSKSNELWLKRKENLPYKNLQEALTLASIIEKEGSEKSTIAGVFINRLKMGMKLQSDPTVIYALGESFDGDIKKKDLRVDSPYNTYRYKGLPPGPISIVSEDSLEAALNPLETEFLYFVSKGDGFHKFSKTLSEHNAAVLKYQINGR